ncbi:MAG: hypothetical protein LBC70_10475 [Chitinispirillales bacterium]|nr:hypothetical protein [Chitinispirillales bacterium]
MTETQPEAEPPLPLVSPLSSALMLPGLYVSYNVREGYRKYDGMGEYQHISIPNPFMFGLSAGKRFALKNPRLRIQSALELGWGGVDEGEYGMDILRSNYFTFGIQADAHLLFHTVARTFFLSAGPGLHATSYGWTLKESSSGREVDRAAKGTTASPSLNVGAGMEYMVSNQRAVSVGYNLRFWRTAHYTEAGALFPMGIDYREYFFSHSLQVQILMPALRHGGRFQ